MSMIPKGGNTIWGSLDWSPDVSHDCSVKKRKNNDTRNAFQNDKESLGFMKKTSYGRLISFGKDIAELHSSKLERLDFRVMFLVYIEYFLFCLYTVSFFLYFLVGIPDFVLLNMIKHLDTWGTHNKRLVIKRVESIKYLDTPLSITIPKFVSLHCF